MRFGTAKTDYLRQLQNQKIFMSVDFHIPPLIFLSFNSDSVILKIILMKLCKLRRQSDYLAFIKIKGIIISSIEMPPCCIVSR
jgi:hypothetical protein